jgi:hypothetical protein
MLPRAAVLHAADRRGSRPGRRLEVSFPARSVTHAGGQLRSLTDKISAPGSCRSTMELNGARPVLRLCRREPALPAYF